MTIWILNLLHMLLARHDMRLIMFSIFTILILHSWGQNFSPKENRLNGQRLREIKCEKFKHDYMSSDESYYNVWELMIQIRQPELTWNHVKHFQWEQKWLLTKKKKELWCDLKDGDNRESVTIPFAMERALTKCLSGRNLKNFVEWAVSSRLCM